MKTTKQSFIWKWGLYSISRINPKIFLLTLILTNNVAYSQTEKPKQTEVKKSESSCDNYAEFKKKQKALKEKQAQEASKTNK